jgi:phage gpG-like protein
MAKPSFKVTDLDKGWKALKDHVIKLSQNGAYVQVGVVGREAAALHKKSSLTVAQIATIHEFGATFRGKHGNLIRIPERSFLRATVDEYSGAIQQRATAFGRGVVLMKFTPTQAMSLLGEYVVGLIKQRIANGIAPANAPSTIARKGSSTPLIDSGQLRGSITYKIEGVA